MSSTTFSTFSLLLIGVWTLSVTIPSFHHSPSNSYQHSDNSYLTGLTVVGSVNLVAGIVLYVLGKFLERRTIVGMAALIGFGSMVAIGAWVTLRGILKDKTRDDAMLGEKSNLSLIGPIILSLLVVIQAS
jgi:uncharacterized membrane protein YiaA